MANVYQSFVKEFGELASDAKLTVIKDGGTVCKLNINVPVASREPEPEFHMPYLMQVSVFGALARQCQVLLKGQWVWYEGRHHVSRYKDSKQGHRASLGIIGESIGLTVDTPDNVVWFPESRRCKGNGAAAGNRSGSGKSQSPIDAFINRQEAVPGPAAVPSAADTAAVKV